MSRRMRDRGHVCCVYLVSVMLSQLTLKNAERACLRKIAFFFGFVSISNPIPAEKCTVVFISMQRMHQ